MKMTMTMNVFCDLKSTAGSYGKGSKEKSYKNNFHKKMSLSNKSQTLILVCLLKHQPSNIFPKNVLKQKCSHVYILSEYHTSSSGSQKTSILGNNEALLKALICGKQNSTGIC